MQINRIMFSAMVLLLGVMTGSCARNGIQVNERADSQTPAILYEQVPGIEPVAFEVNPDFQDWGFGRAVDSLESAPMPWAVMGGESFRATDQGYSESDDVPLVVSGIMIPEGAFPMLSGTIRGAGRGVLVDDMLRNFQRQINEPVLLVVLGQISTGSFNNNNVTDDYQDALIQVVVLPLTGKVDDEIERFIPDRRRESSDDPRFNGVLIPLTDQTGISLQNPESMRFAVTTVEPLGLSLHIKSSQFVAFQLADIDIRTPR